MTRSVRRIAIGLVLFFMVEYLVLPQIAGARKALHLLSHINLLLVGVALLLEAGSLLAYAQLTRSVLPRSSELGLLRATQIDLSTLAVSHVVPGGAAAGGGTGYRLLTHEGLDGSDVGFALAAQGLGSAVVLNVLLWLGLLVSIPLRGFNPLYGTAAIVGVLLIGGFSALVLLLVRGEARAEGIFRGVARRIPFLHENSVHQLVHHLAARLRTLASDRSLLLRAVGWAAANWLLDMGCLLVFLAAFGHRPLLDGLVVSYGLANVVAAIPITPGGLGVLEVVLTSSLVGFGVPRGVAILGVIGYRLVNFWLPIPVGGFAYLSLRAGLGAPREAKKEELRRLAVGAIAESEDPSAWAARHGVAVHRLPEQRPSEPEK